MFLSVYTANHQRGNWGGGRISKMALSFAWASSSLLKQWWWHHDRMKLVFRFCLLFTFAGQWWQRHVQSNARFKSLTGMAYQKKTCSTVKTNLIWLPLDKWVARAKWDLCKQNTEWVTFVPCSGFNWCGGVALLHHNYLALCLFAPLA